MYLLHGWHSFTLFTALLTHHTFNTPNPFNSRLFFECPGFHFGLCLKQFVWLTTASSIQLIDTFDLVPQNLLGDTEKRSWNSLGQSCSILVLLSGFKKTGSLKVLVHCRSVGENLFFLSTHCIVAGHEHRRRVCPIQTSAFHEVIMILDQVGPYIWTNRPSNVRKIHCGRVGVNVLPWVVGQASCGTLL